MTSTSTMSRSIPATVKPMLARLARWPFDSLDYIFELKWDGIRALAVVEGGRLRLLNRNGADVTSRFPELSELPGRIDADSVMLDGELVCLDKEGRPSSSMLQQRLQRLEGARSPSDPVHFIAFDILYLGGKSAMREPLADRKNLLHDLMRPSQIVQSCEFVENDGKAFFQATCELGLEGIVAKAKSSLYFPGKRSRHWLKIKRVRETEFVIAGYTFDGKRNEAFNSLILGLYDSSRELQFVGHVSTGISKTLSRQMHPRLQDLHTPECPFSSPPNVRKFIYWCRPEMVCQVEYGEFTERGALAYPVLKTLRPDKRPSECTVSDAPGWPVSSVWP